MAATFTEASRVYAGLVTGLERRCLQWMARRMPPWVTSDHLTVLALAAMALAGGSFALARLHSAWLWLVPVWLAVNWFGDSLDGTVARVRKHERPRYGFYVDHVLDVVGVLCLVAGMGLSGYMSPGVAAAVLIAYYFLSIEIFLATYCLGTFHMSFWGIGPSELRIGLAAGTLAVMPHPTLQLMGRAYLVFDVAGAIAAAGLMATACVSAVAHIRELYRAEPLPARTGARS